MEIIITFCAGFLAALLGSMSGGGAGFFSFYSLLYLGLPLNAAIATNKFGDLGLFPTALRNFHHKKLIKKKIFRPQLILEFTGVTIGTLLIIQLNDLAIKYMMTVIIIPIFFMLAFKGKHAHKRKQESAWWKPVYFLAAVHSGAFQVGSGFIKMFSLINLRGIPPLQAAANSFTSLFPFAILSVCFLAAAGLVDIYFGLSIFAGNLLGAHIGSKIAIKKGNDFVRYMLLTLMAVTFVTIWFR